MLRVGSWAVQRAYERCLVTPGHRREIQVIITDLDGNVFSHSTAGLANRVLTGEVNFDVKRIPTRILDLTILDPSRSVRWEPTGPGEASMARSRMIQVVDSRYVSEIGRWVDVEVFTGPIQPSSTRLGAELRIVAHGLEVQAMGALWKRRVFRKKTKKTRVVKELLREAGESHLGGIPDMPRTTARRIVVGHLDPVWPVCKRVAASMNRVLFYNGRGRPIMRRRNSRTVFEFNERHLLSEVEIGKEKKQGAGGVGHNTFEVIGKNPKGPKKAPRAVVTLPPKHQDSPRSLKRNGQKLYLPRSEEREHAKTKAECRAIAKRWRNKAMKVTTSYQFEALPIPHLEEYDAVRVKTRSGKITVEMEQWVLPLSADAAPMRVGSDKVREAR
jgi:hypothetical protein